MKSAVKVFLLLSALVLTFTSAAKLISMMGVAEVLNIPDLLFGVTLRWVMLASAVTELIIVLVLFSGVNYRTKLIAIQWIASLFLGYRLVYWFMGFAAPCPCMGNAYKWLGIDALTASRAMGAMAVFLFVGSAFLLLQSRLSGSLQERFAANER